MAAPTREQLVAAFQRADAAQDVEAATELARRIRALDAQNAPSPPSIGQQFGRAAGILGRDALEGAGAAIGIITDPFTQTYGAIRGERQATQREAASMLADRIGLPRPNGGVENVVSATQQAVAGGAGIPALARTGARALTGLGRSVLERMAMNPGTQVASAAGAGAGSEIAGQAAQNVGFSPEIETVARLVGGVAGGIAPLGAGRITSPIQSATARTLRDEVSNVDDLLSRPAPSRTPGVTRTVLEETLSPEVANLQRRITATGATAIPASQEANIAAQVDEIGRMAGTPSDLAAAEAARNAVSLPMLNSALRQSGVDVTRALSEIGRAQIKMRGRDTVQKALGDLKRLITDANKMTPGRPASTILDTSGNPVTPATAPTPVGADVQELYNIRNTIGDMLEGRFGGEAGVQLKGMRELIAAREALDRIVSRQVPEYGQFLSTHRNLSRPVNEMEVLQELQRRTIRSDADQVVNRLMPNAFVQLTEGVGTTNRRAGANALAREATQFNRANTANILSPGNVARLQSIRNDLIRRQAASDQLSRTAGEGSQTAITQNLTEDAKRSLSEILDEIWVAGSISRASKAKLNEGIAEALANPARARQILARFPPPERRAAENAMLAIGITLDPTPQETP